MAESSAFTKSTSRASEIFIITFEATPALGPAALRCLLWRRGGVVGPIALVLFPPLLLLLAWDPASRAAAALLGGACLMLLVLFLLAVWHRQRIYQGWQYIAIPADALPDGAAEFALARIKATPRPPR
jgi:hypothetical protein